MRSLFSARRRRQLRVIEAEAELRGVPVEELPKILSRRELSDLVHSAAPDPELAIWRLPARAVLIDRPSSGVPAVDAAVSAAAVGEWRPAAEVLAESYGDWDLRSRAVAALAGVAADDDGWLVAWRTERPDDGHAAVVDAAARTALAWQLWHHGRSATRYDDFRRVLDDARTATEEAIVAMPDDPTPRATMVRIAGGLKYDHAEFDLVWRELVARAPLHRHGHEAALNYWSPGWLGSNERMFAFAEEAAGQSPSLSVLVLRAALTMRDTRGVWRRPAVRAALDVLLPWLDSGETTSVDVRDDLGFAAMALVENKRGVEAVRLFQRLGSYAAGEPWCQGAIPKGLFDTYRLRACQLANRTAKHRLSSRMFSGLVRSMAGSGPEAFAGLAPVVFRTADRSTAQAHGVVSILSQVCLEQRTSDRPAVAIEVAHVIVDICRPRGAEFELSLADGLYHLSHGRQDLGEPSLDEAREAVEILTRHRFDEVSHTYYASALTLLARELSRAGDHDAAIDTSRRAAALERQHNGVNLLFALSCLHDILTAAGRGDEALPVKEELDRRAAARPPE